MPLVSKPPSDEQLDFYRLQQTVGCLERLAAAQPPKEPKEKKEQEAGQGMSAHPILGDAVYFNSNFDPDNSPDTTINPESIESLPEHQLTYAHRLALQQSQQKQKQRTPPTPRMM